MSDEVEHYLMAYNRADAEATKLRAAADSIERVARVQKQIVEFVLTAPFDRDLQLAIIDIDGPHALVFACRRILNGWIKAETGAPVDVRPTHWREWTAAV